MNPAPHRNSYHTALPLAILIAGTGFLGPAAPAAAGLPAAVQEITVSGRLQGVWGDPPEGPPSRRVFLVDDEGRSYELRLDELQISSLGRLAGLTGRRATVTGAPSPPRPGAPRRAQPVIEVRTIQAEPPPSRAPGRAGAALVGSQPWVNLLCRFSDRSDTPHPPSWFETLMGGVEPGLDHYWREASFDQIDIVGTAVAGWYDLPEPQSAYVSDFDGDGETEADLGKLVEDCTSVADPDIYFPDFIGINLMFNASLGCCAWGGGYQVDLDGQSLVYRVTWEPPWGYENQEVMAHEMGHGFGLPHSSGPYQQTYDSNWDVMSGGGACRIRHPDYGCVGVHTISFHKDLLEWIPPARRYEPVLGSKEIINLEPLDQMPAGDGYLMARIPFNATDYYTVEARRLVGYDEELPARAVVIHTVTDEGFVGKARVVDRDGDGDPNDDGARWLPGETFVDDAARIAVTVLAETASGYEVDVSYGASLPERTLTVLLDGEGEGTVTSEPTGITCGSAGAAGGAADCSYGFTVGSLVTLTAVPDSDANTQFEFVRWTGACDDSEPLCTLSMDADQTITARFGIVPPQIAVSTEELRFAGMRGTVDPQPQTVEITNTGGSPLTDLSLGPLQPAGAARWLGLSLDGATAPAVLTVAPTIDDLEPGTYAAVITLASETASNSPGTVLLGLTVAENVSVQRVVDAILGDERLPTRVIRYLDGLGNADGMVDLADFLAWIELGGAPASPADLGAPRKEARR